MSARYKVVPFTTPHGAKRWHVVKVDGTKVYDSHDRGRAEREAERRNLSPGLAGASGRHGQEWS